MFFEQLLKLIFNEIDHFSVLDHIHLVEEDDDLIDTNLSTKEYMFLGLGHGAISSSNNQNTSIHLGSTSNHVLNIIDVTGAVNMGLN